MTTAGHTRPSSAAHHVRSMIDVLWDERQVSVGGRTELHVEVPLVGWFTPPSFGDRVASELEYRWARDGIDGIAVADVVGVCSERRGRRWLALRVVIAGGALERELPESTLWDDLRVAVDRAATQR